VLGVAWHATTTIVAGVEDLVQRITDDRTGRVLGGRTIERLGGAVCSLHHARGDEKRLVRIHSCFPGLGMLMVYNYSNTCLCAL
jgi:hypothetical protein